MAFSQIGRGGAASPSEVVVGVLQVAGVGWVTGSVVPCWGRAGFQRPGSRLNCWCV